MFFGGRPEGYPPPPPLSTLLYSRESRAVVHKEFLGFSCVLHTAWSGVWVKVVTLNVIQKFFPIRGKKAWVELGQARYGLSSFARWDSLSLLVLLVKLGAY